MPNNVFNYIFKLNVKNNKVISQINGVNKGVVGIGKSVNQLNNNFRHNFSQIQERMKSFNLSAVIMQVNAVSDGLKMLSEQGLRFSTVSAELSAAQDITGDQLKTVEKAARKLSKTMGVKAADALHNMQTIADNLNLSLKDNAVAVEHINKVAATFSKAVGKDMSTSTDFIVQALQQFNKTAADAKDVINVTAAAIKVGGDSYERFAKIMNTAGADAHAAGISYRDTAAAVETLKDAGIPASQAASGLSIIFRRFNRISENTRQSLQAQGVDVDLLTNKNANLADRLKALAPIQQNGAELIKVVGSRNVTSAQALIRHTDTLRQFSSELKNTNVAYEQAGIVMESPEEKAKRLQSRIDDLKLSFFNATGGALGYAGVLGDIGKQIFFLSPLFSTLKKTLSGVRNMILFVTDAEKMKALWDGITATATKVWTAAQRGLNAAMKANPLGIVITIIGLLVGAITLAWKKSEGFRKVVLGVWEVLKSFGQVIKDYVITRFKELLSGITGLGRALMLFFKGKWKDAWEAGKKAVVDLSGINSGKEAIINARKAGENIGKNYAKGERKGIKAVDVDSGKKGILPVPNLPGVAAASGGQESSSTGNATVKKTNDAIATGGTKNTTVNISIGNMVKDFVVKTGNIQEAANEVRDKMVQELTRAIAMGGSMGS